MSFRAGNRYSVKKIVGFIRDDSSPHQVRDPFFNGLNLLIKLRFLHLVEVPGLLVLLGPVFSKIIEIFKLIFYDFSLMRLLHEGLQPLKTLLVAGTTDLDPINLFDYRKLFEFFELTV